jgi:hypothetical protein
LTKPQREALFADAALADQQQARRQPTGQPC